jgi:hypothetical protein
MACAAPPFGLGNPRRVTRERRKNRDREFYLHSDGSTSDARRAADRKLAQLTPLPRLSYQLRERLARSKRAVTGFLHEPEV